MDGFYVGDIIGNSYTHENEKYNLKTKNFKLFTDRSKFSDDTILSFATIYWLLYTNHKPNEMIDVLKQFFKKYPDRNPTIYGESFVNWITNTKYNFRKSSGNGGAMRSSVIGWYASDMEELRDLIHNAIMPTHNDKRAIIASEIVAVSIFLLKNNYTKEQLISYIEKEYDYNLHEEMKSYKNKYTYTSDSKETVRPALVAFIKSTSYEDSIRNAVSFGGDTDTITTINSSIAEAYYKEIPRDILNNAIKFLPDEFLLLLKEYKVSCKKKNNKRVEGK